MRIHFYILGNKRCQLCDLSCGIHFYPTLVYHSINTSIQLSINWPRQM